LARTDAGKKKSRRMPSVCATCARIVTSAASGIVAHACSFIAPVLKKYPCALEHSDASCQLRAWLEVRTAADRDVLHSAAQRVNSRLRAGTESIDRRARPAAARVHRAREHALQQVCAAPQRACAAWTYMSAACEKDIMGAMSSIKLTPGTTTGPTTSLTVSGSCFCARVQRG
jgi:hypothetical protein